MNHTATEKDELKTFLDGTFRTLDNVLARQEAELRDREVGVVSYVGYGIVRVNGLPSIRADELVPLILRKVAVGDAASAALPGLRADIPQDDHTIPTNRG